MVKRRTLEDFEADKNAIVFNQGLEAAASLAERWAEECSTGRGVLRQGYLNLATAIRKLGR